MGVDKASLPLRLGQRWLPAAVVLAEQLRPMVGEVFLSRRRGQPSFELPVIRDQPDLTKHPLSGVLSALEYTNAQLLFVVPVDVRLSAEALQRFFSQGEVRCAENPLLMCLSRQRIPLVKAAITENKSVYSSLAFLPMRPVPELVHFNRSENWENPVKKCFSELPISLVEMEQCLKGEEARQAQLQIRWPHT